jgi:hypothetical protein
VLRAQQEVVDSVAGYVRGIDEVSHLERSVDAANRAVELSLIQYTGGAADYTRVLTAQQSKIAADQRLTQRRGAVTSSVIGLYKAIGGGWEIRDSNDFVPGEIREQMQARTEWGDMLTATRQEKAIDAAAADTPPDGSGGHKWRWWWPQW